MAIKSLILVNLDISFGINKAALHAQNLVFSYKQERTKF